MTEKRVLSRNLTVSAVGLGCMGFTHAYGAPSDEMEAANAIRAAADMGYTFFDTAECYIGERADGTTAYNEELLGAALREVRNQVVIATKYGVRHENRLIVTDSKPDTIRRSIDGSLKRLGVDHIDLYYQHRIDPQVTPEEVAGVMRELMDAGKITHWGISEANEDYLRRAHAVCPVTAVQNRYSMMARWHEALFPVLEELGVGYVAFSPLANGILSGAFQKGEAFEEGDYRAVMPQYSDEAYEANRELFRLVSDTAKAHDATPAQLSLAWMLCKKPYIVPIPGSRKTERIRENAGAAGIKLSPDEVALIDRALDNMEMSAVFGGSPIKQ